MLTRLWISAKLALITIVVAGLIHAALAMPGLLRSTPAVASRSVAPSGQSVPPAPAKPARLSPRTLA